MPPKSIRRQRIADTAVEVLARTGGRGLTHRAVDEAAEVPPGTTSNYFRSRKALLDAIADRLLDHQLHNMEQLSTPATMDQLVTLVAGLVGVEDGTPRARYLARIELFLEATRDPDLLPALTRVRESVVNALGRLLEAAGYPDRNPEQLHVAASLLNGLIVDHLVFTDTQWKLEPAVRAVLATLTTEGHR